VTAEEPTTELAELKTCCPHCDQSERMVHQHNVRFINVATKQELNRYTWRVDRLSTWYIIGWVLIALMILVGVLLNHFWH
jgi:hypothetical protein